MAVSQMRSKEKTTKAECERLKKLIELVKPKNYDQAAVKNIKREEIKPTTSAEVKPKTEKHKVNDNPDLATASEEPLKMTAEPVVDEKVVQLDASVGRIKAKEETDEPPAKKQFSEEKLPGSAPVKGKNVPKGYGLISKAELRAHKQPQKERRMQTDEDTWLNEKTGDYGSDAKSAPEDYATWLPPEDQAGDGTSKLNAKFAGRY
jgi:hypothetical protein